MNHAEIVSRLIDCPTSEVIHAITMQDVLIAIARRMWECSCQRKIHGMKLKNHLDIRPYSENLVH